MWIFEESFLRDSDLVTTFVKDDSHSWGKKLRISSAENRRIQSKVSLSLLLMTPEKPQNPHLFFTESGHSPPLLSFLLLIVLLVALLATFFFVPHKRFVMLEWKNRRRRAHKKRALALEFQALLSLHSLGADGTKMIAAALLLAALSASAAGQRDYCEVEPKNTHTMCKFKVRKAQLVAVMWKALFLRGEAANAAEL